MTFRTFRIPAIAFLALLWASLANAATCTLGAFVASPPLPSTLYVKSSYAANERVFTQTYSGNFDCTGSTGETVLFGPPSSGIASVTGTTNLSYATATNSTYGTRVSAINVTSGGAACQGGLQSNANNKSSLTFTGTSVNCKGSVTTGVVFFATSSGAVGGTIPAALNAFGGAFANGWLNVGICQFSCSSIPTGGNLATLSATSSITLTTEANTCTLSASAVTATLPTVSNSASTWSGVGTETGSTPVPLSIICPQTLPAVGLRMTLSFAALVAASGTALDGTILANGGTATGVGIRFKNSAGANFTSGTPIVIASSITAGTYQSPLTVSYVQTAASVGAGSVSGTATYLLQYY